MIEFYYFKLKLKLKKKKNENYFKNENNYKLNSSYCHPEPVETNECPSIRINKAIP